MLSFVLMAAFIGAEPEPPSLDKASMKALVDDVQVLKAKVAALEGMKSASTCHCGPNCPCGKTASAAPLMAVPGEAEIKQKRNKTVIKTRSTSAAFECVNNQRARKGLRPFAWNESLARAAEKCAAFKAAHCLSGHTSNDFGFIDDGAQCVATGADGSKIPANDPNWWTCCMDENYPYAGAGMAVGADGNKYYSLFVSYSPGNESSVAPTAASSPVQYTQSCANGACQLVPVSGGGEPTGDCVGGNCSSGSCSSGSCASGSCGSSGRHGLFGRRR